MKKKYIVVLIALVLLSSCVFVIGIFSKPSYQPKNLQKLSDRQLLNQVEIAYKEKNCPNLISACSELLYNRNPEEVLQKSTELKVSMRDCLAEYYSMYFTAKMQEGIDFKNEYLQYTAGMDDESYARFIKLYYSIVVNFSNSYEQCLQSFLLTLNNSPWMIPSNKKQALDYAALQYFVGACNNDIVFCTEKYEYMQTLAADLDLDFKEYFDGERFYYIVCLLQYISPCEYQVEAYDKFVFAFVESFGGDKTMDLVFVPYAINHYEFSEEALDALEYALAKLEQSVRPTNYEKQQVIKGSQTILQTYRHNKQSGDGTVID